MIEFRFAEPSDLKRIYALLLKNEKTMGEYTREWLDGVETRVYMRQCCVVVDNFKLVGVAGYELGKYVCDVCDLCVAEEYRRQGIAKKLLEWIINDAQSCCVNELTVRIQALKNNKPACALYDSIGYVVAENKDENTVLYHITPSRLHKPADETC